MRTTTLFSSAVVLFFVSVASTFGQGTKEDYRRARSIPRTFNQAFDARLSQVQWFPEGQGLWYRTSSADGKASYMMVDGVAGSSVPLFDREKLIKALVDADPKTTRTSIDVLNAVPIATGVRLRLAGEACLWDVRMPQHAVTRKSLEEEHAWMLERSPRAGRSGRAGARCNFLIWNDTKRVVDVFWVDGAGKKNKYAELKAGESFNTSTFAGHAWSVVDKKGKTLGRWVADGKSRWAKVSLDKSAKKKEKKDDRQKRSRAKDGSTSIVFKDHNIFLKDEKTGKEKRISDAGTQGNAFGGRIHWSPDRRFALVFRTKSEERRRVTFVESAPKKQLQPQVHTFDYVKPGDALTQSFPWLVDVGRKSAREVDRRLFDNPYHINRVRWHDDSSAVTFFYNQRGHGTVRVLSVDSRSGRVKAIVNEETSSFFDYAGKFFLRFINNDKDLIWMSERSGWNHLYRINARTGKVRNAITSGDWVVRSVDRVDEEKKVVYFWGAGRNAGEDPYHRHYYRVGFDGKNLTALTEGDGTHKISTSPDGRFLVDTWSRVDLPPQRTLRRNSDGSKICDLGACDTTNLENAGWQRPERFVAKGRDGKTDIWGILFRPSNFDPQKKYPVIEAIYAGPHSAHVPKEFRAFHGPQQMAELGFLVVKIDGMGTSHRSKAFHDVCWKNLGDAGFPDRIAWMKALAKKEPAMDLNRVGIYGGSAGGQNAMRALIAHHDFYKVAVADCGCHDNRMDKIWWNELWMSYPIGPHYAESSNVDQAHRLEGKLLLIVGEVDRNVDPASTMQVVDALIKADKDFDMLVIPGAGHGAAGTPYGSRRQQDFFVRHLLGVEPRL